MSVNSRSTRFGEATARPEALGQAESFLSFQEALSRVAKVERPVLLVGERGTGKELAVTRLHYLSQRWQGPLVALNCAALSESVLESELFGHEAGAFTGAMRRRVGRFEAAEGGTLFLDEIGLIPVQIQEKILRVVEYREFERVGGSELVRVDARIIGATNADLPALAARERFKRDLLDRLSFEVLFLPPLRERQEDILLLARHFAARMALELGREPPDFSATAIRALEAYDWPGNIRELKNVVERAVYRCQGSSLKEIVFDPFADGSAQRLEVRQLPAETSAPPLPTERGAPAAFQAGKESLPDAIARIELEALQSALRTCKFHQGEAAEFLGLTYHQFRGLYRKHKEALPDG
ncbi:MAG: phage shock protein operon transcriptional activator [Opitutales bacterium]|nr:phage shock protein operon transcriptional activator [Opitutales bacterium]